MKRIFLFVTGLLVFLSLGSLIVSTKNARAIPKKIFIPDIPGYKTLKGDFHLHTAFSDGTVWPLTRIDEAVQEGLDVIAITDHIDYQKVLKLLPRDHNRAYQISQSYALKKNILLVKGVEINEKFPPGHFNALFIKDGQAIDKRNFRESVLEAKQQGGFVIWNHPGLRSDHSAVNKWREIHSWLYENKILKGIEIYSHDTYYKLAFEWALERNLTIFSNTDNHHPIRKNYDLVKSHRPITLVFAKERSVEAVKEAFLEGRTAAYSDNMVRGFEKWLNPLFHSCVKYSRKGDQVELTNCSGIPIEFRIEGDRDSTIRILKENSFVGLKSAGELKLRIMNFEVAPGKNLEIEFASDH